jgi:2-oxoglutarate ferredoxin oxidoreductase subunit beta
VRASTAPYGHIEQRFPVAELAVTAGAAFVARSTVYHVHELEGYIRRALAKDGFSLVEAMSYCHTTLGRLNRWGTASDMMRQLKEQTVTRAQFDGLDECDRRDLVVRGVFADCDLPEYTSLYAQIIDRAQAERSR